MEKNDLILSLIGLLIVLIGAIVLCSMKSPAGLLVIIPSGIPHIYRLYCLVKEKHKK